MWGLQGSVQLGLVPPLAHLGLPSAGIHGLVLAHSDTGAEGTSDVLSTKPTGCFPVSQGGLE